MALCCGAWAFFVASGGYFFLQFEGCFSPVEHGLQGTRASVAAALGVQSTGSVVVVRGLSCSSMWDLPGSGMEPVSPALAGKFFITEPPGKPHKVLSYLIIPSS